MPPLPGILVASGLLAGTLAASAALYGRYRTLPPFLTGPNICRREANGCQVLFRTRNAALLGVPNALAGVVFYALVALGLREDWPLGLLFAAATAALAMSAYLGFLLVRDGLECRICWAGHIANALVWIGLGLLRLGAIGYR